VDGWSQGFVLPPGGGQLSITHNDLARELSMFAELIAVLAICLLALPGKRADPVEEAEALTVLREASHGRRTTAAQRRAARPAGVRTAGHRVAGGTGRPGFARPHRAGRPAATAEQNEGFTGAVSAEEETAAGLAVGQPAGHGLADDDASLRGADQRDVGQRDAPWDMAGDWGSHPRAAASGAWATAPVDDPWRISELADTGQRDTHVRMTLPQSSVPEADVPGAHQPDVPSPWETGPRRPPWESGPQPSASPAGTRSTETHPRFAFGSGPQPELPSSGLHATGAQLRYPWETGPQRPVTPGGGQPAAGTGGWPAARTGAQPVMPAGAEPAAVPPWESGEWPAFDELPAAADPAGAGPEPATGSGPWPTASRPAKPERHSHRAAKHGRPSRWRGAGKRSGEDGES
jgi:hypothetical protein